MSAKRSPASRLIEYFCYFSTAVAVYFASPLLVYAAATLLGMDRGMDNSFADFLDCVYEPAQRPTEKWDLYDRYILWCLKVTRQI